MWKVVLNIEAGRVKTWHVCVLVLGLPPPPSRLWDPSLLCLDPASMLEKRAWFLSLMEEDWWEPWPEIDTLHTL